MSRGCRRPGADPARSRTRWRRRPDERGSATLFAVACLGVLLVLGATFGVVVALVVAHRTAQAAADLAALAAASAAARGDDACGAGGAIAEANGADVVSCVVEGRDVAVTVGVDGPDWLVGPTVLAAEARAGPA